MKKSLFLIIIISLVAIFTKYYISNYKIEYKVNGYDVKTIYKDSRFYFEMTKDITYNFYTGVQGYQEKYIMDISIILTKKGKVDIYTKYDINIYERNNLI